jgi:catechol 2,3-dioxygenase-like lactoylglutathione lyase family enzyme
MQGLIGVTRIYLKHAAILVATGLLFQFAAVHSGAQDKPKRPRITGIDHVRLYVTDIGKANAFYEKLLGLPTKTAYGCRTASLPCFPVFTRQQIELQQAPSPPPNNWLAEVAYATDNIKQMRQYLRKHYVGVTPTIKDANGARHFELRDPEGNRVSFIQRAEMSPDWAATNNHVSVHLIHAGFVVRDMAAENRFYVDLLGFKLYWYGGMKDDGVDWYELQVPDGDNWIEYMLNVPATADHKQLGAQNHFSFGVNEIQAAADQLRKNGIEKIAGPGIGRDGKRGLNVYDPDDTRVEVTEFTPAREPCCHTYTAPHPTP